VPRKNVFVVGLDDANLVQLRRIAHADRYAFHALYRKQEVKGASFPVRMILEDGPRRLDAFDGPVDAIVGYWDFPVSTVLPILRRHCGLPSPSLESVLKCEHKYWSRCEQASAIPDHVPPVQAIDPFADDVMETLQLDYPFWIKPVKSVLSHLGFRISDEPSLRHALAAIRAGIDRYGEPFNEVLERADLPPPIAAVDGYHCIAEGIISAGRQVTVEGYVLDGQTQVYGTVDSVREGPHQSSFSRYQYPSSLPDSVTQRRAMIAARFFRHIGFDHSPFNIEFYWNPADDGIYLLEVNTRVSKSHSPLFEMVDGCSHFQVMVQVALGERPDFIQGDGEHAVAAKFMLRRDRDARVTRVPAGADIARVQARFPGTLIETYVSPGMRLSAMHDQDSYSYEVAALFMGAASEAELLQNYAAAVEMLPFGYEE
jgi:hypothetical protein